MTATRPTDDQFFASSEHYNETGDYKEPKAFKPAELIVPGQNPNVQPLSSSVQPRREGEKEISQENEEQTSERYKEDYAAFCAEVLASGCYYPGEASQKVLAAYKAGNVLESTKPDRGHLIWHDASQGITCCCFRCTLCCNSPAVPSPFPQYLPPKERNLWRLTKLQFYQDPYIKLAPRGPYSRPARCDGPDTSVSDFLLELERASKYGIYAEEGA
jgi:hypothetical protein